MLFCDQFYIESIYSTAFNNHCSDLAYSSNWATTKQNEIYGSVSRCLWFVWIYMKSMCKRAQAYNAYISLQKLYFLNCKWLNLTLSNFCCCSHCNWSANIHHLPYQCIYNTYYTLYASKKCNQNPRNGIKESKKPGPWATKLCCVLCVHVSLLFRE